MMICGKRSVDNVETAAGKDLSYRRCRSCTQVVSANTSSLTVGVASIAIGFKSAVSAGSSRPRIWMRWASHRIALCGRSEPPRITRGFKWTAI